MSLASALTSKFFDPAPQVTAAESKFAGFALEVGLVGALLKFGASNANTPAQVTEMQAQEDQRKAAATLEEARRVEAQAEDDRRKAFYQPQALGL